MVAIDFLQSEVVWDVYINVQITLGCCLKQLWERDMVARPVDMTT